MDLEELFEVERGEGQRMDTVLVCGRAQSAIQVGTLTPAYPDGFSRLVQIGP
jgi:hypothetical protein